MPVSELKSDVFLWEGFLKFQVCVGRCTIKFCKEIAFFTIQNTKSQIFPGEGNLSASWEISPLAHPLNLTLNVWLCYNSPLARREVNLEGEVEPVQITRMRLIYLLKIVRLSFLFLKTKIFLWQIFIDRVTSNVKIETS